MPPLCLQACSERVKEVGGVCVCVGIYMCVTQTALNYLLLESVLFFLSELTWILTTATVTRDY